MVSCRVVYTHDARVGAVHFHDRQNTAAGDVDCTVLFLYAIYLSFRIHISHREYAEDNSVRNVSDPAEIFSGNSARAVSEGFGAEGALASGACTFGDRDH